MSNLKSELHLLPMLPGWITITSAAKRLQCSATAIRWRINNGDFTQVYRLGEPDSERFVVVLSVNEVEAMADRIKAGAGEKTPADIYRSDLREWNLRVKDWARQQQGRQGEIHTAGQPSKEIRDAYEKANPTDRRPTK